MENINKKKEELSDVIEQLAVFSVVTDGCKFVEVHAYEENLLEGIPSIMNYRPEWVLRTKELLSRRIEELSDEIKELEK